MTLLILATAAAFFWALSNVIDKLVISRYTSNLYIAIGSLSIAHALAGSITLLVGSHDISSANIGLSLIAGVLYFAMIFCYFYALKTGETSSIVSLFYLAGILILIFSAVFFDEILTLFQYIGVIALIIGAIGITSEKKRMKFERSFWWMMGAVLASSAYQLITKQVLFETDFWTTFGYVRIGAAMTAILFVIWYWKEIKEGLKTFSLKAGVGIATSDIVDLIAIILFTKAISTDSVTLANALSSVQPFFVLALSALLAHFAPKLVDHKYTRSVLFQKLVFITLMFIGIILIS